MTSIKKQLVFWYRRLGVRCRFYLSVPPEGRILDLGCGAGYNGLSLRDMHPFVEMHGLDLNKAIDLPSFYAFHVVDLDSGILPFQDEFFDAVVFTHVIEHLQAPMSLGPEIGRVMKRGAKIYIEAPNWTSVLVPSFSFRREQHNPFNFYDDPTHIRPWSKHGLFEFISQACGLHVQRVGTVRTWLWVPLDPFLVLIGLISRNRSMVASAFWNLYGWCIFAVGQKE